MVISISISIYSYKNTVVRTQLKHKLKIHTYIMSCPGVCNLKATANDHYHWKIHISSTLVNQHIICWCISNFILFLGDMCCSFLYFSRYCHMLAENWEFFTLHRGLSFLVGVTLSEFQHICCHKTRMMGLLGDVKPFDVIVSAQRMNGSETHRRQNCRSGRAYTALCSYAR